MGRFRSAFLAGVQHSGQFRMLGLMNHAHVVPAEAAGSNYGDTGFRWGRCQDIEANTQAVDPSCS